jgi:hypothetical protein
MKKLVVFDPPMCCSTGVCGPVIDPTLPRFAADLGWLVGQGIVVERYNLSQQPQVFAMNEAVKAALAQQGTACLPLMLMNGKVVSQGNYPSREDLSRMAGLEASERTSISTEAIKPSAPTLSIVQSNDCEPGKGCC